MRTATRRTRSAADLVAERVPLFAASWLGFVALTAVVEIVHGRFAPASAAVFVASQAAVVGAAVVARSLAHAQWVVLGVCAVLAVTTAAAFASFGGSAEILGVLLFALTASAAGFFVWGWRRQLVVNAAAGAAWAVALPRLGASSPPLEAAGITLIATVVTLGLAESLARTFRAAIDMRDRARAANDALQASYDAYRDLAENARDFIWTADLDGRLTYVNAATARLLGDEPAALVGRSTFEFITDHPDNLDIAATLAEVAGGEPMAPRAVQCRTVHGNRWFEVAGTAIRDRRGRVVGLRAIGRDITDRRAAEDERRRAEDALHESEARYRGLVESTQAVFTRTDLEGRLLFANDAICRLIGQPRDAILGQTFFAWVHPDDQEATRASMERILSPPYRVLVENRVPTVRGWRWFEWEASVIRDADGTIREFQTIGLDVTERKEAERALRTSEARYRSLVESGLELIARADPSGRLLFANDACLRAFRLSREDVEAGRATIAPYVHEEDLPRVIESFERVQQPPYRNVIINRVRIADTWRWLEWEQSVVRDDHGVVTEIQGAGRDVTERHVAEEALRRSLEELKRSEETLRRLARRQAAIREEERKRLGLDLHDNVCQELAAVGVLLEASRVPNVDVAELARASRHLSEVIEHLRLIGRDLRPMMLSELGLTESLRSYTTKVSSLQRQVVARFPTAIPRLDEQTETAVYRVAQEALGNALRHAGAQRIDLVLWSRDGTLLLEVRDDGCGFDPTACRSDSLGLASMEERALALGGRLEIVSKAGQGACVRLECPLKVRSPATAA